MEILIMWVLLKIAKKNGAISQKEYDSITGCFGVFFMVVIALTVLALALIHFSK